MGCVFCNIVTVEQFGTEEEPQPNPFYCKDPTEREEFLAELANDIVTRHPEFLERLNTLAAKTKRESMQITRHPYQRKIGGTKNAKL